MKITVMNGGLGNQLFQYAFYRCVCHWQKDECYIDDSCFFLNKEHNGYELERIFKLAPPLLSRYFTEEQWAYCLEQIKSGRHLANLLEEMGFPFQVVAETPDLSYKGIPSLTPPNRYDPAILRLHGNIYYHGYWINGNWFNSVKDELLKELNFPKPVHPKNQQLLDLADETNSIGVHIRRGDFIKYNLILNPDYYIASVKSIREVVEKPLFFLFSDDLGWCLNHYRELGFDLARDNLIFVDGNREANSYIDMQIMSRCRHLIIANSAFSYFAALLNRNPGRIIMNPIPSRPL